ncbi:MAG: hypothetical protein JF606_19165 [Burkholderiales bacterium]|jgi:hypothetical protein|nr:hypothetical protein [Burkholderiales bacterium]
MPLSLAKLLDDESVFERTPAGLREAVFAELHLEPTARRILLVVNGEIPLRALLDMLQLSDEHVADAIVHLVRRGLIRPRAKDPE